MSTWNLPLEAPAFPPFSEALSQSRRTRTNDLVFSLDDHFAPPPRLLAGLSPSNAAFFWDHASRQKEDWRFRLTQGGRINAGQLIIEVAENAGAPQTLLLDAKARS